MRNSCTTTASGPSKVNVSRLPNSDTLVISGKIALKNAGSTTPVAVLDPTLFAATVLKERLAAAGVQVKGQILFAQEHADTARLQLLASTSHSLGGAVRTANKRSQNFYAEMILKTLGRKVVEPASFAAGVRSAATVLDDVGIKEGGYVLSDGSGLSKRNAFSARQLCHLLRSMARSPQADAFIDSLPVSGIEGSLIQRMNAPAYAGKILAKTGHVLGVSALSGYIRSGEKFLAFSILVNDDGLNLAAANALQDRICELLVDFRQP